MRFLADTLRKEFSSSCKIDWNPLKDGKQSGSITSYYPGDDHVDIIGVDYYNWLPVHVQDMSKVPAGRLGRKSLADSFSLTQNGGPKGLNHWLAFARSRGKPLSLPEWGLHSTFGKGGIEQDNLWGSDETFNEAGYFMKKMGEFIATNAANIAYECYFQQSDMVNNGHDLYNNNEAGRIEYLARWRSA